MASATSAAVRSRARVIGALLAIVGLGVLHRAGGAVFDGGALRTAYQLGVLAIALAACVMLVGLVLHDVGRSSWGLPIIQLAGVVLVLAGIPLVLVVVIGVWGGDEMGPALLFAGIAASLVVLLLVLAGQTKAEVDRAERAARRAGRGRSA